MLDENGPSRRHDAYAVYQLQDSRNYPTLGLPRKSEDTKIDVLRKDAGLVAAAVHAAVPSWTTVVLMVSLIFGGCCANVSAWLEDVLRDAADLGRSLHSRRSSSKIVAPKNRPVSRSSILTIHRREQPTAGKDPS